MRRFARRGSAIVQPALAAQVNLELLVVARDRTQPRVDTLARPPDVRAAGRELVSIEIDADVARGRAAERIAGDQAARRRVSREQLPGEVDRPWVIAGRPHRGEPEQPVETIMVGAHPAGAARRILGLAFPLVGAPLRRGRDLLVGRSLEDQLIAFATNGTERAVGV